MSVKYKQLSNKAYALHQKKKFSEAEKLYLHLLEMKPDDSNVLNLLGLLYITLKKEKDAINYLTKAFVLKKSAYVASNLAKAYYFNKEYDNALRFFAEALSIEPSEDIYYSIALTYKQMQDYSSAIKNYQYALKYNPDNYKTYYNMSLAYKSLNDIDNSIIYAEKSAELYKNDEEVYTLLSGLYESKHMYKNAIESLKMATAINPRNHLYFYNLGVLQSREKNNLEAIIAYNTCIMIDKTCIEAYVNASTLYKETDINTAISYLQTAYSINPNEENVCMSLAQIYRESFKNNESIKVLEDYLLLNPNSSEAYSLLATNYMDTQEYDKALECSQKALDICPNNNDYMHGKAIALKYLGKFDEAKIILEEIIKKPNVSNQTKIALGMMYLTEKKLEQGMLLYRKRSLDTKFNVIFSTRKWNPGIDLKDKVVLLYSDCGLGDTIMYSRFISILKNIAKEVILQTDKELVDILKSNYPDINVISKTNKRPKFEICMPIMDLQLALNINFDNIPYTQGYLNSEVNNEVIQNTKKKIGLFWQGNKRVLKNRSIDFSTLKPLFSLSNTQFYSFSLDNDEKLSKKVISLSSYIKSYSDTASLLKNLDVLITIDSSIAHMAGALGVKTFLLLPYTAEWRWFDDTEKCSWYDSVRIFKQSSSLDWAEVITRVKEELKSL